MKLGVIGLGSIGSRHATNARSLGHDVWGYDANGSGECHSLAGLFSIEPHALLICTPATTHADVARQLLALGYTGPLFTEKPLALSVEECEVFRTWPHPVTMVGYNLRFHPILALWKSMGPWTSGGFVCHCDNQKYGNDRLELSHELDAALWLGLGLETVALNGKVDYYYRSWFVGKPNLHLRACCEAPDQLGDQMYVDELAHFLSCVEKHEPTITPFADGIRVVQVCEDAMKMTEANNAVR